MNGSIVTWNLGQVNQQTAQAVTLTVRIANNLLNGTVITNTARITSTDQVSAMAQLTTTVASAPDVTLSKSDGITEIAASQITTYTAHLRQYRHRARRQCGHHRSSFPITRRSSTVRRVSRPATESIPSR